MGEIRAKYTKEMRGAGFAVQEDPQEEEVWDDEGNGRAKLPEEIRPPADGDHRAAQRS